MSKKIIIALFALMMIFPSPARADKEFPQKIQNMITKIQEKAKLYQEKVTELKTKVMEAKERAENFKSQAMGAVDKAKGNFAAAVGGDPKALKNLSKIPDGIPNPIKADDQDKVAEAVGEKYNPPVEEGNDDEQYENIEQIKRELMQDAVSTLYAIGHSKKALLMEEPAPQDVDMNDQAAVQREVNIMALDIVGHMSEIYLMESALQTYQYTQNITGLQREAVKSEEEQKNE